MEDKLKKLFDKLTFTSASDSDAKRENANINGDSAMGTMLKYGTETAKEYLLDHIMPKEFADAHRSGLIHVHDADFYCLTMNCCQIDLLKLFSHSFSTGHGHIRKPKGIRSRAALAAVVVQANQNEMFK